MPSGSPSSYTVMVSPAVPVPVRVGRLSLVLCPSAIGPVTGPTSSVTAPMAGAVGSVRSTVTVAIGDCPLVAPVVVFVAVTAKVCGPSASGSSGV